MCVCREGPRRQRRCLAYSGVRLQNKSVEIQRQKRGSLIHRPDKKGSGGAREWLVMSLTEKKMGPRLPALPINNKNEATMEFYADNVSERAPLPFSVPNRSSTISVPVVPSVPLGAASSDRKHESHSGLRHRAPSVTSTSSVASSMVSVVGELVEAKVVDYETMIGNRKKPFTQFRVEVFRSTGRIEVFRRYSEFRELFKQLSKAFPKAKLPFPDKKALTGDHFTAKFLEHRRMVLDAFLHRVASQTEIARHPTTIDFFSPKCTMMMSLDVIRARNLQPRPGGNFSDPYVKIRVGKERIKTPTRPGTLNPVWNSKHDVQIAGEALMTVDIFDHDAKSPNECIGSATVDLAVLKPDTSHEAWQPLLRDGDLAGELLLGITIAELRSDGSPEFQSMQRKQCPTHPLRRHTEY